MHLNTQRIFSFEKTMKRLCRSLPARNHARRARILCMFGIALVLLQGAAGNVKAAAQDDTDATADLDSRWLPWLGSWRLVPDPAATAEEKRRGDYVVSIRPGDDRDSVAMKALQGETVLFDDAITANGSSRALVEKECSGRYRYSWSETGKRLLFEGKSSCPGEPPQELSGLWMINNYDEWLDIQLLKRQDDKIITLRRYSPVKESDADFAKYPAGRIRNSRVSASTAFSMNEVVELSRKVAPEILEAALVEYHEPFPINSRTLVYLSDAGVSPQVVDLMVALSFPEKFTVERHTASITPRSGSEGGSGDYRTVYGYYVVDPFFPWCWTPYTWSFYWGYGWGWGWNWGWGWYPPYYPGYPVVKPVSSGRLVAGRGYTKVYPRSSSRAKPRSSGSASPIVAGSSSSSSRSNTRIYRRGSSRSTSSPTTSGSRRVSSPPSSSGARRVSSPAASSGRIISAPSGGGGRVSSPSRSSAPSASRGGYSGGGGGRRAKQR